MGWGGARSEGRLERSDGWNEATARAISNILPSRFAHNPQNIRMLTEEWRELDGIYRVEARKKRSKFTADELKNQAHTVMTLSNEITRVKEIQRR